MSNEEQTITLRIPDFDRHLRPSESVPKSFEVSSFNYGLGTDISQGTPVRKTFMYELSLGRTPDAATPVFMRMCATGETINSLTVEIVRTVDGKEVSRVVYECIGATVYGVYPSYSGGEGHFHSSENLLFKFDKVKVHAQYGEHKGEAELVPSTP
jgi:type VI protein secretion system component Hcp